MRQRRDAPRSWKTYEVYERDENGAYAFTPFSAALASSGTISAQVIIKMRKVQEIGWPEAVTQLHDNKGHRLIVKKNDKIWLLKCKPACWRLYFYVSETAMEGRLIYVHAICKKTRKEDPAAAKAARRV